MGDAEAHPSAPRAGGCIVSPRASAINFDWEVHAVCLPAAGLGAPVADRVTHRGGCHCGAVRFEVAAPSHLVCWDCTCSDCRMRRNLHFVVPAEELRITADSGTGSLAEYRWGSGTAQHLFCARCGISPFYKPRSNPDGWAITFQCLDPGTVSGVETKRFDGRHWEEFIDGEGAAIKSS